MRSVTFFFPFQSNLNLWKVRKRPIIQVNLQSFPAVYHKEFMNLEELEVP